ncbi:hypothetical protein CR513_45023, partial [Mucuna pruriens]
MAGPIKVELDSWIQFMLVFGKPSANSSSINMEILILKLTKINPKTKGVGVFIHYGASLGASRGALAYWAEGASSHLLKAPLLLGHTGLGHKDNGSGPIGWPDSCSFVLFACPDSCCVRALLRPSSLNTSPTSSMARRGAAEKEFPFTILFQEAQENDSEGLPSWIDPGVSKSPWPVEVLPCRLDEIICKWVVETKEPFFYLYETLFSKLGIQLPFTDFEQAALQALNVAPTQLHPNSWAFLRAFELLCEDMGWEPSLNVFFWFFLLQQVDKMAARRTRKNLLLGDFGEPLFPLYWSDQPAISVTVGQDHLESWEEEFIVELD